MPTELLAVVPNLDSVDEGFRDFYAEKNGKFVLNVKGADGFELDNVNGLKTALGAERNLKAQLEAQVKMYEGLDPAMARQAVAALGAYGEITPDAAKEAIETAKRLKELDPKKEADRLAAEKLADHQKQLQAQFSLRETELTTKATKAEETVASLVKQITTVTRDAQLQSELAKVDPLDDARDALLILAGQYVKTELVNGQVVTTVVDANGNPRLKDYLANTPFTVADLMAEMRESRPSLFKAENKQGITGTPGNATGTQGGSTGKVNPWKPESFNFTEQSKIIRENPELAKRMKAEAGRK